MQNRFGRGSVKHFGLFIDGIEVDSHEFVLIPGGTLIFQRDSLFAEGFFAKPGTHEVRVEIMHEIVRTSRVYIDNVVLKMTSIPVSIDIHPGNEMNFINAGSSSTIQVAILTTKDFDAATVDASTVTFGPKEAAISHEKVHLKDVDKDGDIDMVLKFRTDESGIQAGDTEATLKGKTLSGQDIVGTDAVSTVNEKSIKSKKSK